MKKAIRDFVGIDVSKTALDVCFHRGRYTMKVVQREDDLGILIAVLVLCQVSRVVFESTGGYARELHRALLNDGVPVSCVPPQRIRKFAHALGVFAKTDAIDASVIALYAATATFVEREAPSSAILNLRALLVRRQQLVRMSTMEFNHREGMAQELMASVKKVVTVLRAQVRVFDNAIKALIASDDVLSGKAATLRSLGGVGSVLCATLLGMLPELGATAKKPQRWSVWRPSIATAVLALGPERYMQDGAEFAPFFTWQPERQSGVSQPSKNSTPACGPKENRTRSPSPQ